MIKCKINKIVLVNELVMGNVLISLHNVYTCDLISNKDFLFPIPEGLVG